MLDTILGGLLGGVTRMVPEVMSLLDKKNERAHELAMMDKNIAADNARAANQLAVTTAQASSAEFSGALEALKEAVKGQGEKIGNTLLDGINALVRPTVTYILFGMWTIVKLASLIVLIQQHPDLHSLATTLQLWWLPDDQTMLAAVLNFWFLGRVFEKVTK